MPKDGICNVTALTNALYQYEVRVKGVVEISALIPECEHEIYSGGSSAKQVHE